MNVVVEQAVPTFFALSSNAAAALHAATGQVVTNANPATAGEYVSLYGTGLGSTTLVNGLNVAQTVPTLLIDGQVAIVTFAGRAPGFVGLDQINVQIPAGARSGTPAPVLMISGN